MKKLLLCMIQLPVVTLVIAQENKNAFEAGRTAGKFAGILLLVLLSILLMRWSVKQRKKGK